MEPPWNEFIINVLDARDPQIIDIKDLILLEEVSFSIPLWLRRRT